ncbi:hypothetical protein V8B55DRAFT_1363165 [Mucor lusitanicus]|uniref:Uncharacterized protein n=2 Tax=Mucor circinelloides f. lusitanicus TaxID=29924 RepID=A0A168LML2_MUCCL|nr:hypothetical protein FB192DRAFT_1461043 [Mucor lusitanicus]OAD03724.1 hypothetical protein MUCCIDRAFT_110600 [Mucor lusitanicus CBS 277.49]
MIGIDNYLAVGSVKSAWVSLYILSIVWGLLYMIRPLFDTSSDISDMETGDKRSGGFLSRIGKAYDVVKDNMFMHLFALSLNAFGAASTKALAILSWIFFALTIVYAVAVMFIEQKMVRAVFGLIFFVLTLIMTSLAFKHGW